LLQRLSIQIFLALNGFDLGEDGCSRLIITFDRDRFAASGVSAVCDGDHHDLRLAPFTARNPKHLLQWPGFLTSFDLHLAKERRKAEMQFGFCRDTGIVGTETSPLR